MAASPPHRVARFVQRVAGAVSSVVLSLAVLIALGVAAALLAEGGVRLFGERTHDSMAAVRLNEFPYLGTLNLQPREQITAGPYGIYELHPAGELRPSLAQRDMPGMLGYAPSGVLYQYRGGEVRSSGEMFDGIFQHARAAVDDRRALRVFFLGASVAFGWGVADEEKYFARLEGMLQRPYPLRAIPAAIPAINTTHENVLFHLTVLPHAPDVVVIINGWNDVMHPFQFGVRPGDPYYTSQLFSRHSDLFFNLRLWLSRRSQLYGNLFSQRISAEVERFQRELMAPEAQARREQLRESIVAVYLANMRQVIESCVLRHIPVLLVLQPLPDYAKKLRGEAGYDTFLTDAYDRLRQELTTQPWAREHFVDVLEKMRPGDYLDPLHFNAGGQQQFATALQPALEQVLPASWPGR